VRPTLESDVAGVPVFALAGDGKNDYREVLAALRNSEQSMKSVLVCDAGSTTPAVARDLAMGAAADGAVVTLVESDVPGANVAAEGASTRVTYPQSGLTRGYLQQTLGERESASDLIVVGAKSLEDNADALAVCDLTDGVLLHVKSRQANREDLAVALARMERAGGKPVGIVVS
jgi:hypothetical protein